MESGVCRQLSLDFAIRHGKAQGTLGVTGLLLRVLCEHSVKDWQSFDILPALPVAFNK